MWLINTTYIKGGNILRYIKINEQNEISVIWSVLIANYVFTEAVVVVSSYSDNFIEETGS